MASKFSILLALTIASSLAILQVQAAAGIKGAQQQLEGSLKRVDAIKGPRQPLRIAQPQPQPQIVQQQNLAIAAPVRAPLPAGPGQVSPVFSSKRPQQQALPAFVPQQVQLAPQPVQQQLIQQQEQEPEVQQQQQQVESSEIDPNAAAQDSALALAAPSAAEAAEEANPKPEPYTFNYAFEAADSITSGSSQREEQQDASGRVTGFYTLKGQDGRDRRVDYVADASGFHATISTNEMGTAPKDAADARWQAQEPSEAQLRDAESATQIARQRALASPQASLSASHSASHSSHKVLASPRLSSGIAQIQQQSSESSLEQSAISQLQEPFEQIRQTELKSRARKSRHAPFYLFTV